MQQSSRTRMLVPWTITPRGRLEKRCFGQFRVERVGMFCLECDELLCGVVFWIVVEAFAIHVSVMLSVVL